MTPDYCLLCLEIHRHEREIMFLPTTRTEMNRLGWRSLDVILVTGDAYIDSPNCGVALIGKVLLREGFRVGVLPQPDIDSPEDFRRLGEPELFWGVTAGSVDSMVANYTASRRRRWKDDATPGGMNDRRPDRACIVYANRIRRSFKRTRPIVLGGIEASLRRIAHYDDWSASIRRSILPDAKADILVYGMGEKTVVRLAQCLVLGKAMTDLRGICYLSCRKPEGFIELPAYEAVCSDPRAFRDMFGLFCAHQDPLTASGLVQRHGDRYLVHNPPAVPLSSGELDAIYALDFEYDVHPLHRSQGVVRAIDTLDFSITTHRGCFGECRFCAITLHQGRSVVSRSPDAILDEIHAMKVHPRFRGVLRDVGGPTANMYGMDCPKALHSGCCPDRSCLYPKACKAASADHAPLIHLLERIRSDPAIRKAHVASGIRHDLILEDRKNGLAFLKDLVSYHTSGQLKIAPEHTEPDILNWMHKPAFERTVEFKRRFDDIQRSCGVRRFLTYYFMAAHPGSTIAHMVRMKHTIDRFLRIAPEQVQIFTPTPSTWSTWMYCSGLDPDTGEPVFVERDERRRMLQKKVIC